MKKDSSPIANILLVATTVAAIFLLFVLVFRAPGVQVTSSEQAPTVAAVSKKVGDPATKAHPVAVGEAAEKTVQKPNPDEVLQMLKEGNERFYTGKAIHPHTDAARLALAGKENQGKYAYATVISCSDSRVPVERIFDAGVMDMFVIRVAGNVVDTNEAGSIEYGLAHVDCPVLVVLGHTQCGAVTAVTQGVQGKGHKLEINIPPLVDSIIPAVKRAMKKQKNVSGDAIIPYAIEENVWQAVEDLFMKSPTARKRVQEGQVKVVGALYDVGTGKVEWLATEKVDEILKRVEAAPDKETKQFAAE
ncbi:MAG: carbonic anhydrase [Desulfobacterales bacterium]|jgi:carbonic anhydrase